MSGYVVRDETARMDVYLIGGPFDPHSIRSWLAWGGRDQAFVFPTRNAARAAIRGHIKLRDVTIERVER